MRILLQKSINLKRKQRKSERKETNLLKRQHLSFTMSFSYLSKKDLGPCTFRPFNIFGLLFLDEEQKTVKSIPCLVFLP